MKPEELEKFNAWLIWKHYEGYGFNLTKTDVENMYVSERNRYLELKEMFIEQENQNQKRGHKK